MTDTKLEQAIQAKGLTAPRITPADIEASIVSEVYFTATDGVKGGRDNATGRVKSEYIEGVRLLSPLDLLTFCVLMLRNGTKIVGINYGAIDPNQHSEQRGREEARAHAIEQIWPLMGYELRERLQSAS